MKPEIEPTKPLATPVSYPRPNLNPRQDGLFSGAMDRPVSLAGIVWVIGYQLLAGPALRFSPWYGKGLLGLQVFRLCFLVFLIGTLLGIAYGRRLAFWCWIACQGISLAAMVEGVALAWRIRTTGFQELSTVVYVAIAIYCVLRLNNMRQGAP